MSQPYSIKRDLQDVAGAQGDVSVIAAVPTRQIRVLAAVISADSAATTVLFESDGSTDLPLTTALDIGVGSPLVLPYMQEGWFETRMGEALLVNTGAAGVSMLLIYAEV